MKSYNELSGIQYLQAERLIKRYPNMVGVGVSEKKKDGKPTGTLALTLYVQKKVSASLLSLLDRADLDMELRKEIPDSSQIDVKQIGKIKALHTQKHRPVVGGISEGHFDITAGTGGVLVVGVDGKIYRVSNNHVYANTNAAELGDPIYQPGPHDGGTVRDEVGKLIDYVTIRKDNSLVNEVDAAIRSTSYKDLQEMLNIQERPQGTVVAERGMSVIKSGRTTGVTHGKITDLDASLIVDYDADGEILFENQIIIESEDVFSQGGDSGSAIFHIDETGELLWTGLLFAGSEDGLYTIANHAYVVEDVLGVKLLVDDEILEDPDDHEVLPNISNLNIPVFLAVTGGILLLAFILNWLEIL